MPRAIVPFCESRFLQDITIAIGRRVRSLNYISARLEFHRDIDRRGDSDLEMLEMEAQSYLGDYVKIAIWERGTAWIYGRSPKQKHIKSKKFQRYADLRDLQIAEIGELLDNTLRYPSKAEELWEHIPRFD